MRRPCHQNTARTLRYAKRPAARGRPLCRKRTSGIAHPADRATARRASPGNRSHLLRGDALQGATDAIDTVLPGLIERDVARFAATIEASPALRARAGLGFEKAEAQIAAAIAADQHARPDDLTPRVVAAVVVALERVLLGVLRTHLLRGSSAAVTRRALRRDCDRAFAIVDEGTGAYGSRPRDS